MTAELQTWIGVIATLAIFSFLIKENPFYRFFEYTVIGMSAAHAVVMTWDNYTKPFWVNGVMKGEYYLLIPGAIAVLYYFRYAPPKYQWLYRYPLALIMGYNIGYSLAYDPRPFMTQIRGTFESLKDLNSFIYLVIFIGVVVYFIFTFGNKSAAVGKTRTFARYAMMMYFGVSFGNTVQGRFSLLLGRLLFLLQDWLGLVKLG
ncbi:MAG TPA: hypothetical protein GX500_02555 [Firmicutes bacterium]|nr:hypothetical protein [Candidatus Fermentithermobacillaceae bacterium]